MHDLTKLIVSTVMWIAVSLISIMSIIFGNNMSGGDVTMAVIAPLVVGLLGTFFIWVAPELNKADVEKHKARQRDRYADEKPKRMSKMDMLMEMMDEDERRAFKETLKRQMLNNLSDGELNYDAESLESLMDEEKRLRR